LPSLQLAILFADAPTSYIKPYLTVPEAAKFLRVSPWSVRRLIDAGSLPAAKAGTASNSKILISRDDLEKFLWAAP
jgi:excisionase family DNA binding protein